MIKYLSFSVWALVAIALMDPTGSESRPVEDHKRSLVTQSSQDALAQDVALVGSASNPTAFGVQPAEDHPSSDDVQSSEDALAQDTALVAEAMGWTLEQAAAHHRAADIAGRIVGQVAAERPDIFLGGVLAEEPGGAPMLYIKGPADDFVRSLVADAEIDIKIVDNQPFSFDELQQRKLQVHRALEAQGFEYISTGFSIADGGKIIAGVTRQPGLPDDPAEILSGLPAALRASVTLTVSDAPILVEFSAFGGTNR